MKHTLLLLLLLLLLAACTDEQRTRSTLEAAGFTEIETTGYDWWSCGQGDDYSTGFRAKNPRGELVQGVVCCGWAKACTVRF